VTPLTATTFKSIPRNLQAIARFKVQVPRSASGGSDTVTVTARGTVDGKLQTVTNTVRLSVPFASFAAAMNTVGVTDDANPLPGNFDPSGYSYSAQNLAKVGVTAGGPVKVGNATVTFPSQAQGTADVPFRLRKRADTDFAGHDRRPAHHRFEHPLVDVVDVTPGVLGGDVRVGLGEDGAHPVLGGIRGAGSGA